MRDDPLALVAFVGASLALFVAALFAGCDASSPSAESGAAATSVPVLRFAADWSVTQSGPLVGGSTAQLSYDAARLPRCRVTTDGVQAWAIAGWFSHDGYPAQEIVHATGNTPDGAVFRVPFGHGLALWFENSDDGGCTDWDSNWGRNFPFTVEAPPEPVIHFEAGWLTAVDGTLAAGADFLVDYDLSRVGACRGNANGTQTWNAQMDYRFDGGAVASLPLTESVAPWDRRQAPARISAPAGARTVEMWFESWDAGGCHQWDSDFGQNYAFSLSGS